MENTEQIILHMIKCKKNYSEDGKITCLFCNKKISKSFIRKHLHHRSLRCKMVKTLILQLMSSVCENYANKHRPVCIICNKRKWSYKGQGCQMDPVCELCCLNIIIDETTTLVHRDVAVCVICGLHCSDKYVTYWASKMESLFIGETCIKKLKKPKLKLSNESVELKAAKLKSFIETAVSSVTTQESPEHYPCIPRLAPDFFDRYERKSAPSDLSNRCERKYPPSKLGNRYERKCGRSKLSKSVQHRGKLKANNTNQTTNGTKSFKIMNSYSSLPFSKIVPNSEVVAFKEAANNMNNEKNSPLTFTSHVSTDFRQPETQACMKHQESGVNLVSVYEEIPCEGKKWETQNRVLEPQEKLLCAADNMTDSCTQTTNSSDTVEVGSIIQSPSLDNGNSNCNMFSEPVPKSYINNIPAVSSSQSCVTEIPVAEGLYLVDDATLRITSSQKPKYVVKFNTTSGSKSAGKNPNIINEDKAVTSSQLGVTETSLAEELCLDSDVSSEITVSQQPEYVIKCVTSSGGKPARKFSNIMNRNTIIIINGSANRPFQNETVKSPRLTSVIITKDIVCEEGLDKGKAVMQERQKENKFI